MKKTMTFSLAILTILWVGSMCMAQEKAPAKRQANKAKVSAEQKAFQETLKTMTPEQQQVAKAKRAFEVSVTPWRAVAKIAAKEKATETLAAINKIIADMEIQFKQQLSRRSAVTATDKANPPAEAKERGAKKAERQAKPKKKAAGE